MTPQQRLAGGPEYSVRSLAEYLRKKILGDDALNAIRVRGEVSNRNESARGHLTFSLKEGDYVLPCFAWQDDFLRFPRFQNGAAIVATGSVTTFPQRGIYQLLVRRVELDGIGDVHMLFEERKRRLAAEGLFDPGRRRTLPAFPFRVALVSSRRADGAVDFVTRLRKTRPHVGVVWCETSVQGPSAPHEIVGALARAGQIDVDVVVVTRGGGSFEDLFAFSDEGVVRAIARCPHPVLSAVGHTVNQQLSDFAADVHAETPSAAAERIGPETRELRRRIEDLQRRGEGHVSRRTERVNSRLELALRRSKLDDPKLFLEPFRQRAGSLEDRLSETLRAGIARRTERLAALTGKLARSDPSRLLSQRGLALQAATLKLDRVMERRMTAERHRLSAATENLKPAIRDVLDACSGRLRVLSERLDGRDPHRILQRGYAIVTHRGVIVREAADVPAGETIEARVARGTLYARVEAREPDGNDGVG